MSLLVTDPAEVLAEISHPVKLAFVPTFSIGLLLLSIAYLPLLPGVSFWLWVVSRTLHILLTLYLLSSWIHHTKSEPPTSTRPGSSRWSAIFCCR